MRRTILRAAVLSAAWLALLPGCMSQPDARYIYQDGEFGVIGIPRNSPFGRKDYELQAKALMSRHFPEGYEIVRSEEVIEGERILDVGRKTEFETEPVVSALNQMVKLGKLDRSVSLQQKDQLPILECRIIYKRKAPGDRPGPHGYAAVSSIKPPLYIDPNELLRCKAETLIAEAKKSPEAAAKASMHAMIKAAHEATTTATPQSGAATTK